MRFKQFTILFLILAGCTSAPEPASQTAPVQESVPQDTAGPRRPDPERYEGAVLDIEDRYAPGTLPSSPIVFAGSSSFTKWAQLEDLWPAYRVLNRGFGGSTMYDLLYYFDRIVAAPRPRQVFVYEGDNDIAAGMLTEQLKTDYISFATMMKEKLPGVPVVFLAVKPSAARWDKAPLYRKFNAWLETWAVSQGWSFLDTWSPILGTDGKPDPELFLDDRLHLSTKGYAKWIPLVQKALLSPVKP